MDEAVGGVVGGVPLRWRLLETADGTPCRRQNSIAELWLNKIGMPGFYHFLPQNVPK